VRGAGRDVHVAVLDARGDELFLMPLQAFGVFDGRRDLEEILFERLTRDPSL